MVRIADDDVEHFGAPSLKPFPRLKLSSLRAYYLEEAILNAAKGNAEGFIIFANLYLR